MIEVGALVSEGGTRFRVWAPRPRSVELIANDQKFPMQPAGEGWFEAFVAVGAGARYCYLVDGKKRPDPASRSQPDGVHAASEVIDTKFPWRHENPKRPFCEWVIYELHVGTFTPEGTFDAVARELPRLVDLGVNAVELMPVGAFPGRRNWGYDGVAWYAPQASYGGPGGLRRLVDAAHALNLAVIADVVYNHLGPEGNYLAEFGPYFTERHHTPWGAAVDFSQPAVRAHVLQNARMFREEFRVDALRLDAVHAIYDDSQRHIVAELARENLVIAESDLGDITVIEESGWNCAAQWADDLHHALHAALTGERHLYYADFGGVEMVARAITDGFALTGDFSRFRQKPFGMPAKHLPAERFVVCSQNHDQVGNRGFGERLAQLRPGCEFAAAATVLLAPVVPLLFMGEEHADPAPFLYFTDHGDPGLQKAVREGRRREYGDAPDPQDPATFERSRLHPEKGKAGVRRFYQALLKLRPRQQDRTCCDARALGDALILRRWSSQGEILAAISLGRGESLPLPAPRHGRWELRLDAADFGGPAGARVSGDRALSVELPPLGVLVWGSLVP
jgi:maltooligosyltrehalose trehalohydrolase